MTQCVGCSKRGEKGIIPSIDGTRRQLERAGWRWLPWQVVSIDPTGKYYNYAWLCPRCASEKILNEKGLG